MKTNRILLSACVMLTVSCSQEADDLLTNQSTEPTSRAVTFNASFGEGTTRATETSFEAGDQIGVWAIQSNSSLRSSGNYADNVPYRYAGGSFTATGTGISLPSNGSSLAYFAVYPYSTSFTNTGNLSFTVKSNQSSHADYTASDLCMASTEPTTSQAVNLTFNHVMSRVMVRLTGSALANKRVSVKLKNVLHTMTLNMQTAKFSTANSGATDIQMLEESKNVFVAVVAPQKIPANMALLEITVNGKSDYASFDYEMTLNSGKQTTLTGEYTENGTVTFRGDINPWQEEGSVPANVVPYDLQTKLGQYIPLYTGTTPPNLNITTDNGAILFSPSYTVYCSDYQNGKGRGYKPGYITNPSLYVFTNQSSQTNTLTIQSAEFYVNNENGTIQFTSYEESETSYICGSNSKFTACFNTTGVTKGKNGNQIEYKTATVISGTKTSTGISNMYHAFVMISKTGDTYNDLMDVNAFRVFKDQDGVSEYTEIDLPSSAPRRSGAFCPELATPWGHSAIANRK